MIEITWTVKYITEFIATAFLIILGNGAVANVDLKGTKGNNSGWIIIAIGYGLGVMMPALMFGNVSGNHINPAFTLGLAFSGTRWTIHSCTNFGSNVWTVSCRYGLSTLLC